MAAPRGARSLPLLTLLCTAALGQDIVFQERRSYDGLRPSHVSRPGSPSGALEFPAGVEGSEVVLLRFGGSFDCRTPDAQLGRCGPLLGCDVMREALLPLTTVRLRFLKKSICRFVGGKPLVCCPSKSPQLEPTTSAPLFFQDRRRPQEPRRTRPPRPTPEATAPPPSPPSAPPATEPPAPTPPTPGFSTAPDPGSNAATAPSLTTVPGAATDGMLPSGPAPDTIQAIPSPASEPSMASQPDTTPEQTSPAEAPATSAPIEAPAPAPSVTPAEVTVPPTEQPSLVLPPGLEVCGHKLVQRITGGEEALPNSWPWLATLGYELQRGKTEFLCGGALITDQHILTAAHCIKDQLKVVRLGDHDLMNVTEVDTVTEHGVAEMWPHEKYNNGTLFNDIAIIKLSSKVNFTEAVHPICLPLIPEMRNANMVRKITFIAGWGTTKFKGEASPVLREAKVRVHRQQLCKQRYRALRHKLSDKQMCASAREDGVSQDTCQGDSGGPMMMPGLITPNWYVMGVVSFGFRCGEPRFPGVYTRVTDYLDWVVDNLR